jgi:Ca2+-binding EF-hand superfamily protein
MEDEQKEMEEFQDFYRDIQEVIEDKQIGKMLSIFAYVLAEIVVDNNIPKNDFISELVNEFDSAHEYLKARKPKEH